MLNVDDTEFVLGDDAPADDIFELFCFVGVLAVDSLVDDFLVTFDDGFMDESTVLFCVVELLLLFELLFICTKLPFTFRGKGFGFIMSTRKKESFKLTKTKPKT